MRVRRSRRLPFSRFDSGERMAMGMQIHPRSLGAMLVISASRYCPAISVDTGADITKKEACAPRKPRDDQRHRDDDEAAARALLGIREIAQAELRLGLPEHQADRCRHPGEVADGEGFQRERRAVHRGAQRRWQMKQDGAGAGEPACTALMTTDMRR